MTTTTTTTLDARDIKVGDHIGIRGDGGALSVAGHRLLRGFMIEVAHVSALGGGTFHVGGYRVTQKGLRSKSNTYRDVIIGGPNRGEWTMLPAATTIRVPVVIEMTPEQIRQYCEEYGIEPSEVREHIRNGILTGIQAGTAGAFWTATLK